MKSEGLIQFIKFGIVGVANTAVDWIVFYLLIHTILPNETNAKVISFLVAMLNSYLWNTIWTFKKEYGKAVGKNGDTKAKTTVFGKFVVVSLIGWAINVGTFALVSNNVKLVIINQQLVPLVCASAAATLLNFFANKFWTYKK